MNILFLDVALLFFIEIIEANLQKGRSFSELIGNLYAIKQASFVKFLALHLSLFYVAFYLIIYQNIYLLIIVAIKLLDLLFKISILKKVEENGGRFSTLEFFGAPDVAISPALRYFGAVFYSLVFYLAILDYSL